MTISANERIGNAQPRSEAPATDAMQAVKAAVRRAAVTLPFVERVVRARRLRHRMRSALGYEPDLRSPVTYNEKLGWRILNDRNLLIPRTTDKVAVRDYVAQKVGSEVLIPLLGVWERSCDIPWDSLPQRFVLKASHGWNMNRLVRDKASVCRATALGQADEWLRQDHYAEAGEWGYRDISPRLLAEEMLLDERDEIPHDFKFFVFHGRARLLRVHANRFGQHSVTFFDEELKLLPVRQAYPPDPSYVLPNGMHELARLAERIGADFDFARVDLYLAKGRPWFGEITHYDSNACMPYVPASFDRTLGDMWRLPDARWISLLRRIIP
jgi:hypothetical protein